MRVLFVTSEVAGIFKLGGLADVSYALPVALTKIGIAVDIALPYYPAIKVNDPKCLGAIAVSFGAKRELVFVFVMKLPHTKARLLLFRHPLFDYHPRTDTELSGRFAFYCQAVATYVLGSMVAQKPYDIIHCNDWHTALVPGLLGESLKVRLYQRSFKGTHSHMGSGIWGSLKSVSPVAGGNVLSQLPIHTILTIHNPIYHGVLGNESIKALGVEKKSFAIHTAKKSRYLIMLEEGIRHADVVTTVSPTFARDMLRTDFGPHVSGILKERRDRLTGILNGIDPGIWNPGTDSFLPTNYTGSTVFSGKRAVKTYLTDALHLDVLEGEVLFGFVGRLDPEQKGLDILMEAIEKILKKTDAARFVLLGTGADAVVATIMRLQKKYAGFVAFIPTFDERLARRMYAGCDVMLVPSKFEPCGLTQMIAMRYGTLPLVRKTGGLGDSVTDGENGFIFGKYSGGALAYAIERVMRVYRENRRVWNRMIYMAMTTDLSWRRSAKDYKKLYEKLLLS